MSDPHDADGTPEAPNHEQPSGVDPESDSLIEIVSSSSRFQRRWKPPAGQTIFTVQHLNHQRMTFHVEGARAEDTPPEMDGWAVDFGALNVQMRDLGHYLALYYQQDNAELRATWRRTVAELGMHMYSGLLAVDQNLARTFARLRRWTRPAQRLTLAFTGPESYLSVPYELLYDAQSGGSLALRHPVCRQIVDVPVRHPESWTDFIADLRAQSAPLRGLLISSGAEQIGATDEISALETVLEEVCAQQGLALELDLLLAGDATPDRIRTRLRNGSYHVVHYAGQIYHDPTHPEQSGLLFAARHEAQLGQVVLSGAEFADLLAAGATRLVYLSASVERPVQETYMLRTDDNLDVLRAVIRAGIPYVVGLRWYAPPTGRQRLAETFYRQVCAPPFAPEQALLQARQAIVRADEHDETWTAPLIVAQHVYRGGE